MEDLRQNITDINELIKKVKENVTKVEDQIPKLNITLEEVKRKYEEIEETIKNNVTNSIEYVKYLIANSRSILDHIPLSMKFNITSQLVLDAPKAAYDPSINNEISLMFTLEDGFTDGFLFFIGDGDSPDTSDYLAIEIVGLRLRFHYKLSSGVAQNVTIDKAIEVMKPYKVFINRLEISCLPNRQNCRKKCGGVYFWAYNIAF